MAIRLPDHKIRALIRENKPLPTDWRNHFRRRQKPGHKERELTVFGDAGSEFRIILRQSRPNPFDFSVIFAVGLPYTNLGYDIRR